MRNTKAIEYMERIRRLAGHAIQALGVAAAEPSAGPSAESPSQTPEDAAAVPNAEERKALFSGATFTEAGELITADGVRYVPVPVDVPQEAEAWDPDGRINLHCWEKACQFFNDLSKRPESPEVQLQRLLNSEIRKHVQHRG